MKWTSISIGLGLLALAGFRVAMRDRAVIAEPIDAPHAEVATPDAVASEPDASGASKSVETPGVDALEGELLQRVDPPQSIQGAVDYRLFSRAGPQWVEQRRRPDVSP